MPTKLGQYIDELDLGEYRQFLVNIAKPSIDLIFSDAPIAPGCSKFGGPPDVSPDFQWPYHRLGPYRFIGQVNLSLVPKCPTDLPNTGLLSFFYAHDEHGESFWGDPGFVLAFYFKSMEQLQPAEPPESELLAPISAVELGASTDLPEWAWWDDGAMQTWPIHESRMEDYNELRSQLHGGVGYLLGYPFNTTLAYNPTPGPEWCSLLTLYSSRFWNWADWLVTFILKQRLREADFSEIKADAG